MRAGIAVSAALLLFGATLAAARGASHPSRAVLRRRFPPCRVPQVLVVNSALPVRSLQQLIALAKVRPGAISYAPAGTGHRVAELFNRHAGFKTCRTRGTRKPSWMSSADRSR